MLQAISIAATKRILLLYFPSLLFNKLEFYSVHQYPARLHGVHLKKYFPCVCINISLALYLGVTIESLKAGNHPQHSVHKSLSFHWIDILDGYYSLCCEILRHLCLHDGELLVDRICRQYIGVCPSIR